MSKCFALSIGLSILLILSLCPLFAEDGTVPQLNKAEISQMLKQLSGSGQISNDEMVRAQKELEGYSQDDINNITKKSVKMLEDPSFRKGVEMKVEEMQKK